MACLVVDDLQRAPSVGSIVRLLSRAGGNLEVLYLSDLALSREPSTPQTSERMLSMLQAAIILSPNLRRVSFLVDSLPRGDWGAAVLLMLRLQRLEFIEMHTQPLQEAGVQDASLLAQLPALRTLILCYWGEDDVVGLRMVPEAPPPALRELAVRAEAGGTCQLACAWGMLTALTALHLTGVVFEQQFPLHAPASLRFLWLMDTDVGRDSLRDLCHLEACEVQLQALHALPGPAAFRSLRELTCLGCVLDATGQHAIMGMNWRSMAHLRRLQVWTGVLDEVLPQALRPHELLQLGAFLQRELPLCTIEFLPF